MNKDRVKAILEWAMRNRAEDAFEKEYYYWTPEAKKLLNKLTIFEGEYGDRLLIGVIGSSGVGKSALARALYQKMLDWYANKFPEKEFKDFPWRLMDKILIAKWIPKKEVIRREAQYDYAVEQPNAYIHSHTALIDTPDYGTKDIRLINRDLNNLHNLWNDLRFRPIKIDINLVIFFQKELVERQQHFFFKKMDKVELKPLKPKQLLEAFKMRFESYEPFTEDSLTLIAELSRGVFRRFMRYVQLSLEEMILERKSHVTIDDVKAVITDDILMEDMELEFADMFRNETYKKHALRILKFLRDVKETNQKTIAESLGIHPTILGRIVLTLEDNGYVKRIRGKRKTWKVKIQ